MSTSSICLIQGTGNIAFRFYLCKNFRYGIRMFVPRCTGTLLLILCSTPVVCVVQQTLYTLRAETPTDLLQPLLLFRKSFPISPFFRFACFIPCLSAQFNSLSCSGHLNCKQTSKFAVLDLVYIVDTVNESVAQAEVLLRMRGSFPSCWSWDTSHVGGEENKFIVPRCLRIQYKFTKFCANCTLQQLQSKQQFLDGHK